MATAQSFKLRNLRDLLVVVAHPADADGEALVQHIRRIGCRVEPYWPTPNTLPTNTDIVFALIDREHFDALDKCLRRAPDPKPAVIAVVDYENPATLQLVLDSHCLAVTGKPFRPFGVLTNLVVARSHWLERQLLRQRASKAEDKLAGQKRIALAKSILMKTQGFDEEQAHESLRNQAMAKRLRLDQMAAAIIAANDLLNFSPKSE